MAPVGTRSGVGGEAAGHAAGDAGPSTSQAPSKRQRLEVEPDYAYEPKSLVDLHFITADTEGEPSKRIGVHKVFLLRYSKFFEALLADVPSDEVRGSPWRRRQGWCTLLPSLPLATPAPRPARLLPLRCAARPFPPRAGNAGAGGGGRLGLSDPPAGRHLQDERRGDRGGQGAEGARPGRQIRGAHGHPGLQVTELG